MWCIVIAMAIEYVFVLWGIVMMIVNAVKDAKKKKKLKAEKKNAPKKTKAELKKEKEEKARLALS
jgi:large-conductance mechanosensitive channel